MSKLSPAKTVINRGFYRTATLTALPIVVQHLISISLNMVDTMMIGKIGVPELAGVGAANRIYFIYMVICFGFYAGASAHLAQYWGVKDIANIRRIMGVDYVFTLGLACLTMLSAYIFAPQLIDLFTDQADVVDFGVRYLRIAVFSYIFTSLTCVISFNSRAIHRLSRPTVINALALACNTFLNYCLIYGNFGFPALGVEGAAIATVIARVLEFSALTFLTFRDRLHPLAGTIREMLSFDRAMVKRVVRTALPAVVSETTWSVGVSVYYIAFDKTGMSALAVVQVTSVVCDLFQSFFYGLGNACAVMIGNELGRRQQDIAYAYAKRFIRITLAACLIVMGGFWLLIQPIVDFYALEGDATPLLAATLRMNIYFLIPRMLTYTLFAGVLRAGGETRYCMILDLVGVWCIGVPLAFIGALTLHWSLPAVVALTYVEEVLKMILCLRRLNSRKWIKVLI